MIITYPVQIPYTLGSQQRVVPDAMYNNSEILSRSLPMGKNRFWHGGVHLHPIDRDTPIRTIADGELVAYRYDAADATDAFFDKVPYSRSFVPLQHEIKLGQTTLGTSKLAFYSLYMHLRAWNDIKEKADEEAANFLKKMSRNIPKPARTVTRCWTSTSIRPWQKRMMRRKRLLQTAHAIRVPDTYGCGVATFLATRAASRII